MPDKPAWFGRLDEIVAELASLPRPWVDRRTVERVIGVGRRRAQQILAPCVEELAGSSGVASRDRLIAHLQELAAGRGDAAEYERRRRVRLAKQVSAWRRDWEERPRVLVEGREPAGWEDLPEGVEIRAGEIWVRFATVTEGLEKLLALGLAIGADMEGFARRAGVE